MIYIDKNQRCHKFCTICIWDIIPPCYLTHWGQVMHVSISKLGQHWLGMWSASNHYLNHHWLIINQGSLWTNFSAIWIKNTFYARKQIGLQSGRHSVSCLNVLKKPPPMPTFTLPLNMFRGNPRSSCLLALSTCSYFPGWVSSEVKGHFFLVECLYTSEIYDSMWMNLGCL